MAGFFDRLKTIFGAKADSALDRLEDPRQTLDYSYQKQLELLQQVRKGVAEVATSRKRVELQLDQLNAQIAKYDDAARQALTMNREDLAREAYLGTLKDAGMKTGADIESGWLGNCGMVFWGQNSISGKVSGKPRCFETEPKVPWDFLPAQEIT